MRTTFGGGRQPARRAKPLVAIFPQLDLRHRQVRMDRTSEVPVSIIGRCTGRPHQRLRRVRCHRPRASRRPLSPVDSAKLPPARHTPWTPHTQHHRPCRSRPCSSQPLPQATVGPAGRLRWSLLVLCTAWPAALTVTHLPQPFRSPVAIPNCMPTQPPRPQREPTRRPLT